MRGWIFCLAAGVLGACSSPTIKPSSPAPHEGKASYHALNDDHMAHYQLAMGSTSSGAAPIDHPAPSYPDAMLASCPAQVKLQALLIVGTDGKVDEVRAEATAANAPFVDAVRAAVLGWRFEPLIISRWAADANDETHPVDAKAEPFSLPYEFRFACHAGSAQVSSASTAQQ